MLETTCGGDMNGIVLEGSVVAVTWEVAMVARTFFFI